MSRPFFCLAEGEAANKDYPTFRILWAARIQRAGGGGHEETGFFYANELRCHI